MLLPLDYLKRHGLAVERTGCALLVAVDVLFVTGAWQGLCRASPTYFARLGSPQI
ncbi:MAG TPA: hypothetical protein VHD87_02170 [Acidimicrobiales bacterium]|nr:hypothetical protein [Acidimicrobiales bacterium]